MVNVEEGRKPELNNAWRQSESRFRSVVFVQTSGWKGHDYEILVDTPNFCARWMLLKNRTGSVVIGRTLQIFYVEDDVKP